MKTAAYVYSTFRRNDQYFRTQANLLIDKARLAGVKLETYSDLEILHAINEMKEFDFIILDLFSPSLAEALSAMGFPLFHGIGEQYSCYDKGLMYLKLAAFDVPCVLSYASLSPGKASLADCFEYLSEGLKKANVHYPFTIRPRYDEKEIPGTLILGPHEMFATLQKDNTPFIAEERIDGAEILAYVVGKKCLAVLEKKKDKETGRSVLKKTALDNRFVRQSAIMAIDALGLSYGIVHFKMKDNLALVCGVSPYLALLEAEQISGANIAETLFIYLKKRYKEDIYWTHEEKVRFRQFKSGQKKIDDRGPKEAKKKK